MANRKVLVTGAAGFIGYHLCDRLLRDGYGVVGIDNLNNYYDVRLKLCRLTLLSQFPGFGFFRLSLEDQPSLHNLFMTEQFDIVINLAGQAGVRYSIDNPQAYVDSNISGFLNVLEGCRQSGVAHLLYASSSSVYGNSGDTDHPISIYAASKKCNELMAYTYSHQYGLPCTGMRFFTVYGPWGRPDMALFKFIEAIVNNHPIDIYGNGNMQRAFTYVDDIVESINRLMDKPTELYKIYDIGNTRSVQLSCFIETLESALGKKAIKNYLPMQPGDVTITEANTDALYLDTGYKPETGIKEGIAAFVGWYQDHYGIRS